ncbi:MAG TPA: hypothetical protein VK993_09390 [Chthoniobacterales bacterium]|nr:hypothetical protein [Chthoniobacterales bacterium]
MKSKHAVFRIIAGFAYFELRNAVANGAMTGGYPDIRNPWRTAAAGSFEAPGVEPCFVGETAKDQAISYADGRTAHRVGEIRVFNAAGEVEQVIPFDKRAENQRV